MSKADQGDLDRGHGLVKRRKALLSRLGGRVSLLEPHEDARQPVLVHAFANGHARDVD